MAHMVAVAGTGVPAIGVFALLAALSAVLVRLMIGRGVLDVPGARSSHDTPTPRGGGVGPVTTLGLALLGGGIATWLSGRHDPRPFGLLAGCLLLAWVSHQDDIRQGHFRAKLGAQLAAAAIAVASGLMLPHPPGVAATLAAAGLSLAWLLFATNAMNFIDGLNGLAAGSMLLAALAVATVAAPGWPAFAALALAAGLAGFLPFNYPHARIFLGDVGSQPCGFAIAALGLGLGAPGEWPGEWNEMACAAALLVPALLCGIYYDVAFTLVRRWRAGERLTQAHRSHLYQLAQRSFLSAPAVSAVHFVFVAWGAMAWLAWARAPWAAIALLAVPQLAWTALVLHRARPLL